MTSCLRSSSTSISRLSRRGLETFSRQRLSSARPILSSPIPRGRPCARSYATVQPGDPKNPKDNKPTPSSSKAGQSKQSSKSAPGLEHVYNQSSPLSNTQSQKGIDSANGEIQASKLSEEDEKVVQEMVNIMKRGMPKSQREDFEKAVQAMKAEGIPDDLREVIKQFQASGSFDLSTAAKVVRIVARLARRSAEYRVDRESNEPQQKSGAHDPGPQSKAEGQDGKPEGKNAKGFFEQQFKDFGRLDWQIILWVSLAVIIAESMFSGFDSTKEITWQEFRTQFFDKGLVEKLTVVNRRQVKVTLNRDAVKSIYPDSPGANNRVTYVFSIGDVASFERHVDEAHYQLGIPSNQRIPISYDDETPWSAILLSYGPTLLLIGATLFMFRRSAGGGGGSSGIFNIGKSKARKFNHETDIKMSFKDVAGMDEAKQEIMEFVSFLKEPGIYQKLGAKIPRGAILSGPPGTGKTLLAKATAGESGVPFFSVSGSEFVEMFVGVGASRVRDLFQNARKHTPCIIFIDEIDAIGKARGKNMMGGGNDEREATLNQILTEMDGFNTSEQVVVLAGTNRADVLDKALMRPGRFDRHISVDKPTMEGRKQIFAVHLKKIVTKEDLEHLYGRLAALTPGFSGADIANCVNEAALLAARGAADHVTMKHFESAIERVIGGLEKKSLVLNPEEKKTVAYHEAGHAICGWYFKYADPLLKVSIIPRGQGALGYAQYLPSGDTYLMNVNQLMDRMAMTLAGRVSEELHFDTVTSGASDDFNKVTRMATAMVTKWGMSKKIGHLYFEDDSSQQLHKPFSEETAKNIDSEVRRIVDEAYKQCRDLLEEKKREIGLVAEELLKLEVLGRDDLIRLLGPRPFEDKSDFAKYFGSKGDREGVPGSTPDTNPTDGDLGGAVGPAPTVFKSLR